MRRVHLTFENNLLNQYDGEEVSVYGDEVYEEGKHGRGIYLNGSNFVQIPINSALSFVSNDFTIAGWFYVTSGSVFFGCEHTEYNIFGGNYAGVGLQVQMTNKKLQAYIPGTSGTITIASEDTTVDYNTWNHIALTRKDSTFRLFLNGFVVAEGTLSGEIAQYAEDVYRIGSSVYGNTESEILPYRPIKGIVDDFFIDPNVCWWTESFSLRDTYSELLYIQSPSDASAGPYINTGVIARRGIRVQMDVKVLTQKDIITFFGSSGSTTVVAPPGYALKWKASSSGSTKGSFTAYYDTTSVTFGSEIDILDRLCIDYCYPTITINGISAEFPSLSAPTSNNEEHSLYVFSESSSGYINAEGYTAPEAKLYSVDIFIDDTQIRDYIPIYYNGTSTDYFLLDTLVGLSVPANTSFYEWEGPSVGGGHTTLVYGDVYSLGRGDVLFNGTSYEIISGKTLVDGVSYDLLWPCSLVLTGTGGNNLLNNSHAYVVIDGFMHTGSLDETIEVLPGTIVECCCRGPYGGYITVNGTNVATGAGDLTYEYVVTTDATIKVSYSSGSNYNRITITEE